MNYVEMQNSPSLPADRVTATVRDGSAGIQGTQSFNVPCPMDATNDPSKDTGGYIVGVYTEKNKVHISMGTVGTVKGKISLIGVAATFTPAQIQELIDELHDARDEAL